MQRSGVDNRGGNGPLATGRYQSRLELQLMRPPGHYGASYLVPLRELVSVRRNAFSPSASASVAKVSLTAEICLQHKLHNHHAKARERMHTSEAWWLEWPGLPGCIHLRVAL